MAQPDGGGRLGADGGRPPASNTKSFSVTAAANSAFHRSSSGELLLVGRSRHSNTVSAVIRHSEPSLHDTRVFNAELPMTANRNGTWQSCMFHNVTAMVGAGVLGLPSTFSYLGWAAGIIVLLAACVISWYTFVLLCHMHEQPLGLKSHSEVADGKPYKQYQRMDRYIELSNHALGHKWGWIIQPFQIALLWGISITYTVTGGESLMRVYTNNNSTDQVGISLWIVIFASICLVLSQLRNFGEFMWVSAMGACVTVGYVCIAVIMSAKYPTEPRSLVSYSMAPGESAAGMTFGVFNALTTVCFAFGGHNIALEIQASLPGGTTEDTTTVKSMLLGVHVAFVWAIVAYFLVATVGFWAFGNAVASNVIFSINGADWVQSLASLLVAMHVLASFLVYSFPLFDMLEGVVMKMGVPMKWWVRVIIRSSYVIVTALIACLLPFFGDLMGLVGALGITPTTFVYPCILWLILRKPSLKSPDFWYCWFIIIAISIIGVLGTIGSIRNIAVHASSWKVFQ